MARTYAGILGSLAFGIVVARTLLQNGSADEALRQAPWALLLFAVIGYGIGWTAERTIVDAVEFQLHTQLRSGDPAAAGETHKTTSTNSGNQPT